MNLTFTTLLKMVTCRGNVTRWKYTTLHIRHSRNEKKKKIENNYTLYFSTTIRLSKTQLVLRMEVSLCHVCIGFSFFELRRWCTYLWHELTKFIAIQVSNFYIFSYIFCSILLFCIANNWQSSKITFHTTYLRERNRWGTWECHWEMLFLWHFIAYCALLE